MKAILKEENIAGMICFVRGEKVMLDSDIARLYDVETKALKRAVRRNIDRFPEDFMFELSKEELNSLRSQFGTLNMGRGKHPKYMPLVFTEQGVAMLSGILKSKRAVEVNIAIMRTFVQIRNLIHGNKELNQKIRELEKLAKDRFADHDKKFQLIFEAIRQLMEKKNSPREMIGFKISKSK